jgi:hypothetical protein
LKRNLLGEDDRVASAKLVKNHPELQAFGFDDDKELSLLITPAIRCMMDLKRMQWASIVDKSASNTPRVLFTNPNTLLSVWATVLNVEGNGIHATQVSNQDIAVLLPYP